MRICIIFFALAVGCVGVDHEPAPDGGAPCSNLKDGDSGAACDPCATGLADPTADNLCRPSRLLLEAIGFCACQGACAPDCTLVDKAGATCDWRDGSNGTCRSCLQVSCAFQINSCEEDR